MFCNSSLPSRSLYNFQNVIVEACILHFIIYSLDVPCGNFCTKYLLHVLNVCCNLKCFYLYTIMNIDVFNPRNFFVQIFIVSLCLVIRRSIRYLLVWRYLLCLNHLISHIYTLRFFFIRRLLNIEFWTFYTWISINLVFLFHLSRIRCLKRKLLIWKFKLILIIC